MPSLHNLAKHRRGSPTIFGRNSHNRLVSFYYMHKPDGSPAYPILIHGKATTDSSGKGVEKSIICLLFSLVLTHTQDKVNIENKQRAHVCRPK